MNGLNQSQQSAVLSTLRHVDELVGGILRLTEPDGSPLATVKPDLSAYEGRMLMALVIQLRRHTEAALAHLGIPIPPPSLSARWSAVTALRFAEVALDNLSGGALRGYGALSDASQAEVVAVVADLRALLDHASSSLSAQHRSEVDRWIAAAGPAADVLREVRMLADERGLPEVFAELAAVAERAASPVADVGVFGRISSGKSSLINAVLGEPVLPVGVTPMTAVPLRIERGDPGVAAHYEDGRIEQLQLEELGSLATELGNPQNRRGLLGVEVRVHGAPPGVRLLDTPGVTSARTVAAAAAYAWLPRCDIGLVLIPVSAAVDAEDRALVAALRAAGVECLVLLSKADLVRPGELETALDYVRRELAGAAGGPVAVHPISTTDPSLSGITWLREEVLGPLVRERMEASGERLRRRLHHLVSTLEGALAGRQSESYESALARRQALDDALRRISGATEQLADGRRELLEVAAVAVTRSWRNGQDGAAAAREILGSRLATALAQVRDLVTSALGDAGATDQLNAAGLPPLPDTRTLTTIPALPPPLLVPGPLALRAARRRLLEFGPVLEAQLRDYAGRLERWAQAVLDQAASLAGGAAESRAPGALAGLHERVDAVAWLHRAE